MKRSVLLTLVVFVSTWWTSAWGGETLITWHGHSAFEIVTPKGQVLFIDPWLNNPSNPLAGEGKDPLAGVTKADYILITHGHVDHVGDAAAIAQKTGAKLVTNFELGMNLVSLAGIPAEQAGYDTLMNIGGEIKLADDSIKIDMVPAIHSSGMHNPLAKEKEPTIVYGGNPAGFVIMIKDGPTIYHSGDTAFFKDMELIGKKYKPDIALICMGGHFTMEPEMAARAATMIGAGRTMPHHYGTFPVLVQNTDVFTTELHNNKLTKVLALKPGESYEFKK